MRLPEALFTRAAHSRRDDIPADRVRGARAADAVAAISSALGIPGTVQSRAASRPVPAISGLTPTPARRIILLCDGAEIPALDRWMKGLLTDAVLTGPIVLAGAELTPETTRYLTAVAAQTEALQGKVLRGAAGPA